MVHLELCIYGQEGAYLNLCTSTAVITTETFITQKSFVQWVTCYLQVLALE